jgi:prophage tail gpP-like protein
MSIIRVEVDGEEYTEFTSMTLERSKDDMTCSGSLVMSWQGAEGFNSGRPPMEKMTDGAKIVIYLDDQKAATGRIDKRQGKGTPTSYTLTLTFRGLAAALVDSSADHPSGQENKKSPGDVAKKLMDGYEPKLIDKSGEKRAAPRFVVREGETIERAIRTATREYGLVAYENEDGDVVLDKRDGDEGKGPDLFLGDSFTEFDVSRNIAPRFSKITAKGSSIATDKKYGKDAEELASVAIDKYVKYKREFHLLTDGDQDHDSLKKRALTEARRRAANAVDVTLTLDSFSDTDGKLWKVGRLHQVRIPIETLDEQLQVKTVRFQLTGEELQTEISLCPKEAFSSKEESGKSPGKSASSSKSKAATGTGATGYELFTTEGIKAK